MHSSRGVSLTELSIVLTVMGLMIAAVTGGAHVIESTRLRRLGVEMQQYQTAINDFRETYGAYPGDFSAAISTFSATIEGDGDGEIGYDQNDTTSPFEDLYAWQHLQKTKKIIGNFTGTASGSDRYSADSNAPSSQAINEGVWSLYTATGESSPTRPSIYSTTGTVLRIGTITNSPGAAYPFGGVLNAKNAYSVDKKFDDGYADAGFIYGIRGNGASGCTDNAYSSASATYSLTDSSKDCGLILWINKY